MSPLVTFHNRDLGRGRHLFTSESVSIEKLFRATTGEYVLTCDGTEAILEVASALHWAEANGHCLDGKQGLLRRGVEAMRVPYRDAAVPQVRLYDSSFVLPDESVRILELVQHPAFSSCLLKHSGGEIHIQLSEPQRDEVVRIVTGLLDRDFYSGACWNHPVTNAEVRYQGAGKFTERLTLGFGDLIYELETAFVTAGFDLPPGFFRRPHGETTWLHVIGDEPLWSRDITASLAPLAVASCIHQQLNYERCHSPAEDPFEIIQEIEW